MSNKIKISDVWVYRRNEQLKYTVLAVTENCVDTIDNSGQPSIWTVLDFLSCCKLVKCGTVKNCHFCNSAPKWIDSSDEGDTNFTVCDSCSQFT